MPIKLANNASGALATAINASDTGIVLTTGDGAEFPTLGAGDYFYATITSTQGTQEIVKVTARAGDSLTVVRAQEGTTASGFAAGSRFELRVTAQSVEDLVDDYDDVLRADLAAASGSALIGFLQSGVGAGARTAQTKLRDVVSVKDFGALGDGTTDDATAIQEAIDYAATLGGVYYVDLCGDVYAVGATIQVKENVVLHNGRLTYTGATANAAVVSIGTGTSTLIRPAGVENVYVSTTSTATGVCGFRINGLVRNSWIKNCVANMNEISTGARTQYGFEIRSERLATTANAGAYQNSILDCVGINCYSAFRVYTEGTAAQQLSDPQANGNTITGWAYSCVRSAIILEEGAIENIVNIRADTFVAQAGLGTTIYVGDIRGLYNRVTLDEEIGPRADTQYTIRLSADAAFNQIRYHTQNVVTAKVLNSATTNRNTIEFLRPNMNLGGQVVTHSHYTQATAVSSGATNDIRDQWVAPCPCVVLRVAAKLDANVATSGSFFAYVAKNGAVSTGNRVEFVVGEGTTAKYLDTDPSAGVPINTRWVLAKGDTLTFAYTNSSPNAIKATTTVAVLMQSTDVDG